MRGRTLEIKTIPRFEAIDLTIDGNFQIASHHEDEFFSLVSVGVAAL